MIRVSTNNELLSTKMIIQKTMDLNLNSKGFLGIPTAITAAAKDIAISEILLFVMQDSK